MTTRKKPFYRYFGPWKVSRKWIDTKLPGYCYHMKITDVKTDEGLNHWIEHLRDKMWFSRYDEHEFLKAVDYARKYL